MARTREPAKLPADPLNRDMLCFAVTSIQLGAAKGLAQELNDDSELKRWEPIQSLFSQRLTVSLERAKLDESAIDSAFSRVMLASPRAGNADSISRGCTLQFTQS